VPDAEQLGSVQRVLHLSDRAVATSGDYRNFVRTEEGSYSHTIDPRTFKPVEHSLASVSVVHENTAMADALATALLVLGPEQGFEFAKENDIAALFIIRHVNRVEERYTPHLKNYLMLDKT
jgi:thiamine biosynthesis lipoprotein